MTAATMPPVDLAQSSRETIQKGSKSFAAAAALFDAETRADAEMLYAWCRHCDDVIDGQELGHGMARRTRGSAKQRLDGALREDPRRPRRPADRRSRLRRLPARRPAPPHPRALRHRADRRLRDGRLGPPLRDARGHARLLLARRRRRGRDDGAGDGREAGRPRHPAPRPGPRPRLPAHQHLPRRGRGRRQRPHLPARRVAGRGRRAGSRDRPRRSTAPRSSA